MILAQMCQFQWTSENPGCLIKVYSAGLLTIFILVDEMMMYVYILNFDKYEKYIVKLYVLGHFRICVNTLMTVKR